MFACDYLKFEAKAPGTNRGPVLEKTYGLVQDRDHREQAVEATSDVLKKA
jgi:hypothetical protein